MPLLTIIDTSAPAVNMANVIQSTGAGSASDGTPVSSLDAVFSAKNGSGNLIVVCAGYFQATARTMTITDTVGDTFVPIATQVSNASCNVQMWYVARSKGGTNTVHLAGSGNMAFAGLVAVEYASGAIQNDEAGTFATGVTGTFTSGTITSPACPPLVVAGAYAQSAATQLAGTGFTLRDIVRNGISFEDSFEPAAASYTAQWANLSSAAISSVIASFTLLPEWGSLGMMGCGS